MSSSVITPQNDGPYHVRGTFTLERAGELTADLSRRMLRDAIDRPVHVAGRSPFIARVSGGATSLPRARASWPA
jgi:hypothetical protein